MHIFSPRKQVVKQLVLAGELNRENTLRNLVGYAGPVIEQNCPRLGICRGKELHVTVLSLPSNAIHENVDWRPKTWREDLCMRAQEL